MYRILLSLFILLGTIMPAQASSTFTNPLLGDGADPWVVRHDDGFYYYTQTTGSDITLWRTKDITDLENAERKVVWMPAQGAVNGTHLWAPELHLLDGRWYIYFAASDGDMARQRMYVLQSKGVDPFGEYAFPAGTQEGKMADASDKWAIDGTVLDYRGERYFIWSGWEGEVNDQQRLYIARMASPWASAWLVSRLVSWLRGSSTATSSRLITVTRCSSARWMPASFRASSSARGVLWLLSIATRMR